MSVVLVLGLALSSCGGDDAGAESGGADVEPSAEETSPEGGASDPEQSSGDGSEAEEPESSPTPVPASSDGPAQNWPEPEVPDEIYEETEEGALAALKYWFEAITYLQLTGEFEPVSAVSAPDCETCNNKIDQFYDLYEAEGGWYVAEGATTSDEIVSSITTGGNAGILFTLVEGGYAAHDTSGESLGEVTDETYAAEASLAYDGAQWWVLELSIADPQ
ncbi:DUF6318 family protein [Nesterenkonia sp. AY15]|uniref:DUF6318 family protein n=1 Tax=Nesterenkonia sp. AY15 TaxID=2901139 RepID=UPI001F4C8FBE|nr:DUF6318 family protein [Nesterenkonia sp. AY15]